MFVQIEFCLNHLRAETTAVAKNLYLQELHNRNETLFHRLLVEHMAEMAPLGEYADHLSS
jgi:hypothetical protein